MSKAVVFGVATVAVLGGVYLGAAAYSGSMVQKEYEVALDEVTQALPFLRVVDRQYDKGLFSASATYGLQLGCASPEDEGGGKFVTLTFRDSIAHGPLPGFSSVGLARIDTQIVLPENAPESLRQWIGGMKPEAIRTAIDFGGATHTRVELPAGEIKNDNARLHWQAMRAGFRMNSGRTASSAEFELPEIAIDARSKEGESIRFRLVNLRGQSASEFSGPNWSTGNGSGSGTTTLDQVQLAFSKGNVQVDLSQLKFTAEQKMENDLLGTSASFTGTASVKVGERTIVLDKIELQESMKRLHAPTLHKIVLGFWQELGGVCGKTPADFAQSMEEKQLAMLFGMKELLTHNPEYSVDKIAVTYESQEGRLAYSVAADGITSEDLHQPDLLLGKIITKGSARLPIAWLAKITSEIKGGQAMPQEMVDATIGELVGTGYVTREGDFIVTTTLFERGQLTINGKPFNTGALLGLKRPGQQDDVEEEESED
ncbi:MAG: YdgA family protein [Azonexus sp.]|jgi:uncharacterized protein YdgA (DUF945 family)|uniref:YdgA family protein n=1 Tax=Azonexus sp. TaxID=1872668 RepID=UPI00282CA7FD|nr:YdgA family protein [Azonexus sp.]MDR0775077.1 YdgA family protein [Azonexus sp.]